MDKKLKIAIIGSRGYPYVYSGYETLVRELSERLVNRGHHVTVYCHRPLFTKKPKFVNGIELVYTPSVETKFLSQFTNSFFSFIHVCFSKNDVVFVVNSANGPFGLLTKLFRKKTCINVDGLEWLRPKWKGLGSVYFKISSKLSTILFDEVITDSIEMQSIYNSKFKKKSNLAAYGSTMTCSNNKIFLDKLGIKKNEYYLIVGRLIPDNNAFLIVNGFLKSNSNKKMLVIGDVPYNDSYSSKIKSLSSENIILSGYIKDQDELTTLYKNCFGYVHGHQFGGTNPTMINALDINIEIMALDTKFSREMLEGKNVVFFQNNIKSVRDAFLYFEKNFQIIKNKNRDYEIPKMYDWNYITNSYEEVFKSLIKNLESK